MTRPSLYEWFDLRRTVRLQMGEHTFWGSTTAISEVGLEMILTQAGLPMVAQCMSGKNAQPDANTLVELEILEDSLVLQGRAICTGVHDEFSTVRIMFEPVNLKQQRRLVELLFCRPGQWKSRCSPGELRSLWLLFRILLKPQVIFGRHADVSVVSVAKG